MIRGGRRIGMRLAVKIVADSGPVGQASWTASAKPQDMNAVRDMKGEVNLDAIPNTIPGISREELAERVRKMAEIHQQKADSAHRDSLAKHIDTMRRAMPPDQFKEFLRSIEEKEALNAEEAEKMSSMTPLELYRYQRRKAQRENLRQWLNVIYLVSAFFGGIFFLFYFLCYFFY
mmetsp:Transcript_11976/g.13782  ORF Transcript_11976/g.13782 Transcript_11976/m.13782 type:complete len:175 (+) Transcript_11976:52-576(+)